MAAHAHLVTLAWNPSPAPEVDGYLVVYGTASRTYSFTNDVGNVTGATIEVPDGASDYYFAAIAYEDNTGSSEPSVEAVYTLPSAHARMAFTSEEEINLTWTSVPGMGYRVFFKPELTAEAWSPVSGLLIAESTLMTWATRINRDSRSGFFTVQVVDPRTMPRLQIGWFDNGAVRLTWTSIPGTGYRVRYRPNLATGAWVPVSDVLIAVSTLTQFVTAVDPDSPTGFYQIEAIPNPAMAPRVQTTQADGQYRLAWLPTPGMSYRVLYKPDLPGGAWTPVSGVLSFDTLVAEWSTWIDSRFAPGFFSVEAIPTSDLSLTVQIAPVSGGGIKLSWPSIPGLGYRVLSQTNLGDIVWTPVSEVFIADSTVTEWVTQIDPSSSSAVLKVELILDPARPPQVMAFPAEYGTQLIWVTTPGFSYRVLRKLYPTDTEWRPVTGIMMAFSTLMAWDVIYDPGFPDEVYTVEVFPPGY